MPMTLETVKAAREKRKRGPTAIATCAEQRRSFFHFLHESIAANLAGHTPPSLLQN